MRPANTLLVQAPVRAAAPRRAGVLLAAVAALAVLSPAAQAERGDRTKPMSVTADGSRPGTLDFKNRSAVFTGNVVITQGTLVIHADRVEVSEDQDGAQLGYAFGSPTHPATFRQKRDGEDEYSEGEAQKIEYDSAVNRVRFVGAAHLRMLKGATITSQADAALITYDTAAETIQLKGVGEGAAAASAAGRTTVVFTPKAAASSTRPAPEPLKLPTPASGPAR